MAELASFDTTIFRWINQGLSNRVLDAIMPYFSSNALFIPLLIVLAIALIWKGGPRGRLLVFFLLLTLMIGDPLIVRSLKAFFNRSRPFVSMADAHVLVGRVDHGSMPSGHAANWFAATTVAFVFYRRTLWFMLPLALIEAFSRVYLGVHFPSDVLVGGLLGITYASVIMLLTQAVWGSIGRLWFPLWWKRVPFLLQPTSTARAGVSGFDGFGGRDYEETLDVHWLRLAYLLLGVVCLGHLLYLASGKIELSEDEAYQWMWSKHLAISYFSKPPLIAYAQFVGTHLWGDNPFGVRFFSPVLAALTGLLLVRFLAREANGYVACMSVAVSTAAPLLMVGATLMTIDCLSVLFWVAATVAGWRAVQRDSTRAWLWVGLWMGLGFLSKYTAAFQWLCWATYFVLWPPARRQLRRPGPYLAVLINALCTLPVLVWNAQHHWITVAHLANRGGLDQAWRPTLRFLGDFLGAETFLLNPILFVGMIWAAVAFWRRAFERPLQLYLFSMGAPLFLFYLAYTLRARVLPNWIAPAVLPLFALMLVYWDERRREGSWLVQPCLWTSLFLGWLVVVPLHDTQLIAKATGHPLSVALDPLTRVLGYKDIATQVELARQELLKEGKPTFIIGSHYGITSLIAFYDPEAQKRVRDDSLVYYKSSDAPENQFYFWPGYSTRKGQNAIYIEIVDHNDAPAPDSLQREFASVTSLGTRDILYKNRVFHKIHLFACRDLR